MRARGDLRLKKIRNPSCTCASGYSKNYSLGDTRAAGYTKTYIRSDMRASGYIKTYTRKDTRACGCSNSYIRRQSRACIQTNARVRYVFQSKPWNLELASLVAFNNFVDLSDRAHVGISSVRVGARWRWSTLVRLCPRAMACVVVTARVSARVSA